MYIKTNKNIISNSDMYIKINYKKCSHYKTALLSGTNKSYIIR